MAEYTKTNTFDPNLLHITYRFIGDDKDYYLLRFHQKESYNNYLFPQPQKTDQTKFEQFYLLLELEWDDITWVSDSNPIPTFYELLQYWVENLGDTHFVDPSLEELSKSSLEFSQLVDDVSKSYISENSQQNNQNPNVEEEEINDEVTDFDNLNSSPIKPNKPKIEIPKEDEEKKAEEDENGGGNVTEMSFEEFNGSDDE